MSDEDQGNLAHPCGPWRITEPAEPKLVDLWSVADLRDALATMQAERDTAIRERDEAKTLWLKAEEGFAQQRERAEKAESALKHLQDAVNKGDEPCLPTCDPLAHDQGCPHVSMAATLSKLQVRCERLQKALREVDRLAYSHTAGGIGKAQKVVREALAGE